jgi:hypothetical protein
MASPSRESNVTNCNFKTCAILVALLLAGCAKDVPPLDCNDPDYKCYIDHAVQAAKVVRSNIEYWGNVQLVAQALIVISGGWYSG